MIRVQWTERLEAFEDNYVDIPESDIESLLVSNPGYDEDDVIDWLKEHRHEYETEHGDIEYGASLGEEDVEVDEYDANRLPEIIKNFKENNEELYEDEEETCIGVLGYDED